MKSASAKSEAAYAKCSFYKPYLSFLERKPTNKTKSASDNNNNKSDNNNRKKNVVQFYVENENSTGNFFDKIKLTFSFSFSF